MMTEKDIEEVKRAAEMWRLNDLRIKEEKLKKENKYKYMDIYSKSGTKVRFMNRGGYESQRKYALQFMQPGDIFTVKRVDIGNWSSSVELKEIPYQWFNTVLFDVVD